MPSLISVGLLCKLFRCSLPWMQWSLYRTSLVSSSCSFLFLFNSFLGIVVSVLEPLWNCNVPLLCTALEYIGKRGATVGVTREKMIKYVLAQQYYLGFKFYMWSSIMFRWFSFQIRQRDPSKGNASSCWYRRLLWNKESLLFWVSLMLLYALALGSLLSCFHG